MSRLFSRVLREALMLESPINVRFKAQLELISDPSKRSKVENMLRRTEMRNISEPASSTGKYHPNFAHGDYGLSRHTKAVVAFVSDMCTTFTHLDRDAMIIAALMHDMVKYVGEGKYTVKDHAAQAAELLRNEGLDDEARLVASHMGKWDKKGAQVEKEDEKLLHLADYLASRQYISIDFDEDDNIITNNVGKTSVDKDRLNKLERDEDELAMVRGEKEIPF